MRSDAAPLQGGHRGERHEGARVGEGHGDSSTEPLQGGRRTRARWRPPCRGTERDAAQRPSRSGRPRPGPAADRADGRRDHADDPEHRDQERCRRRTGIRRRAARHRSPRARPAHRRAARAERTARSSRREAWDWAAPAQCASCGTDPSRRSVGRDGEDQQRARRVGDHPPAASRISPSANATRRPGLTTVPMAVSGPLRRVHRPQVVHLELDRRVAEPGRQRRVHRAAERRCRAACRPARRGRRRSGCRPTRRRRR